MGAFRAGAYGVAFSDKIMNLKHRLFHKFYPIVVAAFMAGLLAVSFKFFGVGCVVTDKSAFLSSSISLGAILTGFTATSLAILMALPESGVMSRLRTSGYINSLVDCFVAAMIAGFVFVIFNLICFFVSGMGCWVFSIWLFSFVYCLLALFRLGRLMLLILRYGAM